MSKERAETHVSHAPPNNPCARSAMVVIMSTERIGSRWQLAENVWLVALGVLEVPSGLAGSIYT